jgi:phage shock protein PspC (stress-responsive transcriptional regulator)
MATGRAGDEDRGMTETPQHDRVLTENLRDYTALRRSTTDRRIAGVAGGLGRHLNIDPTVIRVLLVVLCFFGGAGFLIYGAAWLLVPADGRDQGYVHTSPGTRSALLIGVGAVAALLLVGGGAGRFGVPWPFAVVALVVFLVLVNRNRPHHGTTPSDAGPGPAQPAAVTAAPEQPRRTGPLLFGFTVALVALALGALGLYDVSGGSVDPAAYPALALAVVGAMLVLGSFFGRAGGLVLLGLVATLALAVTSAASGWDGRLWSGSQHLAARPFSAAGVHDRYSLPAGQVRLDLTRVQDPARLDGRTIDLHANAGELLVLLPADVGAEVNADINGPGAVNIDGDTQGGIGTHLDQTLSSSHDVAHVTLNLDLSAGRIEVRQQ